MANYTFREKENRNGAVYDADKKDKFFVEDITQLEQCILDLRKFTGGIQTKYYETELEKIIFMKWECPFTGDISKISIPIKMDSDGNAETGQMAIYSSFSDQPSAPLAVSDSFTIPLSSDGVIESDITLSVVAGQTYWLAIQCTSTTEFVPVVYAPHVISGVSKTATATGIDSWPTSPTLTARTRDLAIFVTGILTS